MINISAVILAGKREEVIENCLKSLSFCEEKVLVDLGADKKTLAIAKKYQVKVIKGAAVYDFSLWRNQGAKAAGGKWLFYVDTDERVPRQLKEEIVATISQTEASGFYIPRKNYFLGKWFKTEWPDYQLRLFKKASLKAWEGKIHETPKLKGQIGKLKNPLIHLSHRSLESSLANTLNWSKLEAELRLKAGHPRMTGLRFLSILLKGFWQQFAVKKVWRNGVEGVIDGIYQVFSLFFTYVRLWEMQRDESLQNSYKKIDKLAE